MLPKHSGSGLGIGECLWHWPQLAGCVPRVAQVAQLNNSLTDITLLVANSPLACTPQQCHGWGVPRKCEEEEGGGGGETCFNCQIEAFLLVVITIIMVITINNIIMVIGHACT